MAETTCGNSIPETKKTCSYWSIGGYSLGECANSLVMNSISTFAMLYYTQALGLSPVYAGIALSIAVLWDAISDPLMGYVTDHTYSRFGRRHPFILVGGLSMAALLYAVWSVPSFIQTSELRIFAYLIIVNILLRTALTLFFVPYSALGFEMTTDYEGRSRLQGMRQVFNMAANFLGPALAWAIFFSSTTDGKNATDNPENYVKMGGAFAIAVAALTILTTIFTYRYRSNPPQKKSENQPKLGIVTFLKTNKSILFDGHARWVYICSFLAVLNMVIVSSLLSFFYVYFMDLDGRAISIAQFGTVIGSALGGLLAIRMPHWFEKKGTIIIACWTSILGNIIVATVFLTGWMAPDHVALISNSEIPIAFIFFVVMNGVYWMGSGIMIPTAVAMIADIAEINKHQTGELKDGSYAAFYSLVFKAAISFALVVSGLILAGIGFDSSAENHSDEVIWRLGASLLLIGPLVCLIASFVITKYRITSDFLDYVRQSRA